MSITTNSTKKSLFWEANSHSASQGITCILWNPKVHYHVHKSPPIMSQKHPVCTFTLYFSKIYSIIIFLSMSKSSKRSLPSRFPNQNFVHISHLFHACYMCCPSHPPWFDHPNNILWSVQLMNRLIMQSSPASHHYFPLRCKQSPQHLVLKHPQATFFP